MDLKYYSLDEILKLNCTYNFIYGLRGNGKTYSVLKYSIDRYFEDGQQLAYLRRYDEDFKGRRGQSMFAALDKYIEEKSNGKYNTTYYYSKRWYMSFVDPETGKRTNAPEPFAWAFSLSGAIHDKSTSWPLIRTICFDEVLTADGYLQDEFVIFMNLISSICRQRANVKIFMLANTVSKFNIYAEEMMLTKMKDQKMGTIDVYKFEAGTTVACQYCDNPNPDGKPSDVYFQGFKNQKLEMITGTGSNTWELGMHPHLIDFGGRYKPESRIFTYYIRFNNENFECEVIEEENRFFTYIHKKTTELKDLDDDLIYCSDYSAKSNWRRNILKPVDNIDKRIMWFFQNYKVCYDSNFTGAAIDSYFKWCRKTIS